MDFPPQDDGCDLESDSKEALRKATEAFNDAEKSQDLEVLERSTALYRGLLPRSLPSERHDVLQGLASALDLRFQYLGDTSDLSNAITYSREALSLIPSNHPQRYDYLNLLGNHLHTRWRQTQEREDIQQTLQCYKQALDHCPNDTARRYVLANLGSVCGDFFRAGEGEEHLEKAIAYTEDSLALYSDDDPQRPMVLTILGSTYHSRFKYTESLDDEAKAITSYQDARNLTKADSWLRSQRSANLALMMYHRFTRTQDKADLDECIILEEEAANLCRLGEPRRARRLHYLASSLRLRLQHFKYDLDYTSRNETLCKGIALLREAVADPNGRVHDRLEAAFTWRHFAHEFQHDSELEAHIASLNLLDNVTSRFASLEKQYHQLSSKHIAAISRNLVVDAAALAIDRGEVELAVTLLEQGRAMLFSQLGRYRATLNDLGEVAPGLVEKFSALSKDLDALVVSGAASEPSVENQFEDGSSRYQRVRAQWSSTLAEIQALDQSFLRPTCFSNLQRAAQAGPVIVVNISRFRSDAIIILPSGPPILVLLPDASPEDVQLLADRFGARPATTNDQDAVEILREVWRIIVEPVVSHLRSRPAPLPYGSRKWWCPTGAASRLPLHAAGPYLARRRDLPHIFTSSYTPTLGTLIRTRKARHSSGGPGDARTLLIVAQPETPGEKPLPSVPEELEMIQRQVPNSIALEGTAATRDAVLTSIASHSWIHLACHGHHNSTQPFLSHFSMHDKPLSLLDIIHSDLPKAELAILSACHSARVSEQMPDEVLHPAAGMLFAGFRSVVGTMWALEDSIGPEFSEAFYKEMVDEAGGFRSHTRAATALRKAVNELGVQDKSLVERINLVHFGA